MNYHMKALANEEENEHEEKLIKMIEDFEQLVSKIPPFPLFPLTLRIFPNRNFQPCLTIRSKTGASLNRTRCQQMLQEVVRENYGDFIC
jgi:hypothetical protein